MKKILFAIIVFLSFESVYALSLCTPSDEYVWYQSLSDEERSKYIEPVYCKEVLSINSDDYAAMGSSLRTIFPTLSSRNNEMASYYSSVDEGYVAAAENQQKTGLCWNFSGLSTAEASAAINNAGNFNFSEAHLGYTLLGKVFSDEDGMNGRYEADSHGGQTYFVASYFLNQSGQMLEKNMSFSSNLTSDKADLKSISSTDYNVATNIASIEGFYRNNVANYAACTAPDIEIIKERIVRDGAVNATVYMDNSGFHDKNKNYYYTTLKDSSVIDHAVVIVGWDDTISKDKFGATRDGAWIIQNSWGSTWSSDGLFYISYDDEFVCKNVDSYYGFSTKTFDNAYKAADLLGSLSLYFKTGKDKKGYIRSKFTKLTDSEESLERVSFPIANDTSYKIYLSRNDSLDKTNWELLGEGTSRDWGIGSVDVSNVYLNEDFSIIVEYTSDYGYVYGLSAMCNYNKYTTHLEYSKNTNFSSEDGKKWTDIYATGCEPNIYAYTNTVNDTVKLEVHALTKNDNTFAAPISKKNVDENSIEYRVFDASNNDITSNFNITTDYNKNKVYINSDNTVSGKFTFKMKSGKNESSKNFKLVEYISSKTSTLAIDNGIITVAIPSNSSFTYQDLFDGIELENTTLTVNNQAGNNVTNKATAVGTDSTIKTNDNSYKLVVLGDVSGDGTINSADLMKVVKYLIGSNTLTSEQTIAADPTRDGTINSADLMRLVKYLNGTSNIGL